jgi:flagellar hook-length control protein FliK
MWLAEQKVGRAEIRLDPEELGPLEVSLELDGDEIRAEFGSRSAEVRSLLESQVPRLREMLAEHGFSLADAQIGQERHAQQQGFADSGGAGGRSDAGVDTNEASPPATTAVRVRQGLVDDYA